MSDVGAAKSNLSEALQHAAQEAWLEFNNPGSTQAHATQDAGQSAPACHVPTNPEINPVLMHGLQFGHLAEVSEQITAKLFQALLGPISDLFEGLKNLTPLPPGTGPGPLPPTSTGPVVISDPPPHGDPVTPTPPPPLPPPLPPTTQLPPQVVVDPPPAPATPKPTRDIGALADKLQNALKTENDGALTKLVANFTKSLRRENQQDLDALVGELKKRGILDDLSKELAVEGRDAKRRGLSAQFNALSSFEKAVKSHGTAETRQQWASVRNKLHLLPSTAVNDGRLAGKESYDEVVNALGRKDRKLLEQTTRDLVRSFPSGKSKMKPEFAKNKLNSAIKNLSNNGKLDDLVRELKGSKHGQKLLKALDKKVAKYGNEDSKTLLKAFEKTTHGKATIPDNRKPAVPAKPGSGAHPVKPGSGAHPALGHPAKPSGAHPIVNAHGPAIHKPGTSGKTPAVVVPPKPQVISDPPRSTGKSGGMPAVSPQQAAPVSQAPTQQGTNKKA